MPEKFGVTIYYRCKSTTRLSLRVHMTKKQTSLSLSHNILGQSPMMCLQIGLLLITMKTPRINDFDPDAKLPTLKSSLDKMPSIQKPPTHLRETLEIPPKQVN